MDFVQDDEFRGTDRFDVHRRIGSGGMGVVYLATDRQRGELVAVKTLRHIDPHAIYRFKREFRAVAELSRAQLVQLYELFCVNQQWFFTMEYVDGVNFLAYLQSGSMDRDGKGNDVASEEATSRVPGDSTMFDSGARDAEGEVAELSANDSLPPPPSLAAGSDHGCSAARTIVPPEQVARLRRVLVQLVEGVCQLHAAGKLHRDLKPTNVLITPSERVVILDFGLATELADDARSSTTEGFVAGTIPYMSPEQAAGKELTPASDWYSVGAMMYEALTGRTPFIGRPLQMLTDKQLLTPPSPSEIVDGVPDDLNMLSVQLLSRDPVSRPAGNEVRRRLGATAAVSSPISTSPAIPEVPFVGRRQPLELLSNALEHVERGNTVLVSVDGESGTGKSALVRHFLDEVRGDLETVILCGRCYECESVPYKALDSLVDSLSHHLLRLSTLEAEALLPRDIEPLLRVFPVLKRVEALAGARAREHGPIDKQELRDRAFSGLRELLGRLGDRSTLILYIDDLQWSDVDSISLLGELLKPPNAPPLLLIVCQRTRLASETTSAQLLAAVEDTSRGTIDVRHVTLEPLSAEDSRRLAAALWDARVDAPESLITSIASSAAGNPYFLEALVGHHCDASRTRSECRPSPSHTLEQVLAERIASLERSAQKLLQVVSVAGHPMRYLDACRAASLTDGAGCALAALRAARLIRAPGTTESPYLEVYHDRIRETVVVQLPPSELSRLHHCLAEAMETAGENDAATLASHFVAAGEPAKGRAYFLEAAEQASGALAFERAAELYRQASELGESDKSQHRLLMQKRATALANAGRGAEAAQVFELAAHEAPPSEAFELQRQAAMQNLFSGKVDKGLQLLRLVLAEFGMRLPKGPRRALLQWLRLRAVLRTRGLRFRHVDESAVAPELLRQIDICWAATAGLSIIDPLSAAVFQTRGLLLALRCGEPNRIARALCIEAAHVSVLGGKKRKLVDSLLERAETIACRLDNPHVRGLIQLASGIAALSQGRWQAAGTHCDEADRVFRQQCTGVAWEQDCAAAGATTALFDAGDVAQLARRLPTLRDRARQRGNLFALTAPSSMNLPSWAADQPEAAQQILDDCMRHWPDQRFYVQHFSALYDQIQTDLYRGDPQAAWARIAQRQGAVARSLLMRVQLSRAFTYQTRARCALAMAEQMDDPRRMLRLAQRDARRVKREGQDWTLPLSELILAAVAASRRQVPEAIALLEKAVIHFDKVDMVLYAAVARRRLGMLLGRRAGEELVETAHRWMAGQNIVNPKRLCRLFAPGFPEDLQ